MTEPFIFGIPLIARASSANWAVVEALLELTLASVAAQTVADFSIVIAGHDRPEAAARGDGRITFLRADWPAEPVRADNLDSGRKKHAICKHVLETGGGLLMFLDADDWVDMHLVAITRKIMQPDQVGGLVTRGFATDIQSLRTAPLPHPRIFGEAFHRLCGSSTVARLTPGDADPLRRNPHAVLHEHYRWIEVAAEQGIAIAHLPIAGNYIVNTSANHSEVHGPFAEWRRDLCRAVDREGSAVDADTLAPFGLGMRQVLDTRIRVVAGLRDSVADNR